MHLGNLDIFNQPFIYLSLAGLLISFWLFFILKKQLSFATRMSLIGGCLLSLAASFIPAITKVLGVSFLPSAVYNVSYPMTLAPFIIAIIGFFGCWSIIVLAQEMRALLNHHSAPPRIIMTLIALTIFTLMIRAIHNGTTDYNIVLNSREFSTYALIGTDPENLKKIYREVSLSSDIRLNEDILAMLAQNHKSPPELLKMIYTRTAYSDMDPNNQNTILINLTKNPNTPSEILERLLVSASQARSVPSASLAFIPRNPNFSEEMLLQLADYPDCEIRRAIISYPHISENVLNQLIHKDPDMGVRRDAKRRLDFLHGISHLDERKTPQAPVDITPDKSLQLQAEHSLDTQKLKQVYTASESNQNPGNILENLAGNCFINDDIARKIYAKTLKLRNYSRNNILVALAANPKTPPDILNQLIKLNDLAILRALASNPNLPYDLLMRLAPYPDCKIRKKIICHADAKMDIIERMQKDPDQSVSLESNTRLKQTDSYLESCREIQKMNSSCQKFYDNNSSAFQLYPNTSERKPMFDQFKNTIKTFLSLESTHHSTI
ncbi:MAG: hypothetical protein P4M14_05050 [Gammaproteobacteria bacterium]|nr:hypothetical protein [Gammaproteobacteria bacterium]